MALASNWLKPHRAGLSDDMMLDDLALSGDLKLVSALRAGLSDDTHLMSWHHQ
jgi:hypothetical protein